MLNSWRSRGRKVADVSDMPEADAFQVLYDLLAQLETEQPKRFQTLRVKAAVGRLEKLYAEGMATIGALRAKVSELQDEAEVKVRAERVLAGESEGRPAAEVFE